ncbi:MAG: response regulator transcription factor [Myxococcales bacterium]|nr:response regulator transcription factor [Myxococcales bacterium]
MSLILLIDDEPAITESLAYALSRGGFTSKTAHTLADADAALAAEMPALIILDLMLPDGNGLDWLRDRADGDRMPVIILSSHDEDIDHIVGLEIGADDYVDKPFSPREMVARVRAVLRRTEDRPADGPADAPVPLRLDAEKRLGWARGVPLTLSRTEFDLLAVLLGTPGRVFTRDDLLDRAWGPDVNVTERTVDVHVKTLRKKLAAAGLSPEAIETVRGVGYKLSEEL